MHNGIFIISHKRPKCQTAKTLLKTGYKGDWYIIADDMDDTEYERFWGEDKVIRFSKKEYVEKIDTVDNFGKLTTPVYARNACFDIAQSLGWDCFGLFDDDLTDFNYRYLDGKSLKSKKVTNMTEIFEAYCKFIYNSGLACGGFVSAGRLIGGASNSLVYNRFYYNPTNAYIINTHINQFRFIGTLWEDSLYCYLNNMTGKIAAAFMPIVITMESPGSMKDGGNKELYKEGNAFKAESYGNIVIPSFFKWTKVCKRHKFSQNVPVILSGRWKK